MEGQLDEQGLEGSDTTEDSQGGTNVEGRPCTSGEAELKERVLETIHLDEEGPHIGDNIEEKGTDAKANDDGIPTLREAKAADEDNPFVNEAVAADKDMPYVDEARGANEDMPTFDETRGANAKGKGTLDVMEGGG